jgi:hypothetical protein
MSRRTPWLLRTCTVADTLAFSGKSQWSVAPQTLRAAALLLAPGEFQADRPEHFALVNSHLQGWKHFGRHQCLLVVKAAPNRQGNEDRQKGEDTHYRTPQLN